jgi:hypothetical protein
MKKLFSLIIVSILSMAFINSALAGEDTCLKNGDGAIITVAGDSATQVGTLADSTLDSCSDIPDEYKLDFHALALCADDPRELNFSVYVSTHRYGCITYYHLPCFRCT